MPYSKIMIVDSDLSDSRISKEVLKVRGSKNVIICADEKEAFNELKRSKVQSAIQLLFLNLDTVPTGGKLISLIMDDPDLSHIKSVLVSSRRNPKELGALIQLGFYAHLKIPVDLSKLRRILAHKASAA